MMIAFFGLCTKYPGRHYYPMDYGIVIMWIGVFMLLSMPQWCSSTENPA